MNVARAVIVGGGIGGLTTAIALGRLGFGVTVYERASELREVGAGLTLWPNATRILLDLGLDDVVAKGARFKEGILRTPSGGRLATNRVASLEKHFDAPTIAIHRAELHQGLADALPVGTVQLGAECVALTQNEAAVEVSFSNGNRASSDVVIGADGIRSAVRAFLFPDITPRYAGYTGWRGIAPGQAATEIVETWGRGERFGIVPLRDRTYWFATSNRPAGNDRSGEESREELLERFAGWHAPIAELIRSTPASHILQNDIYDLIPFRQWSRGRVVLLGDAAHATTPNLGQGACMAIESAAVLAEELARGGDVREAISAYEKRRMPRTAKITNESWKIGRLGQMENRVACGARNLLMRGVPGALAEKRILDLIAT
jgi:2-polyprenyl-6-methoxyphenol hydroxylase-like FAD-dependent oxidoreductase